MSSPGLLEGRNDLSALPNSDRLQRQVQYLCRTVFGREPSAGTIARYAQFHELYRASLLHQQQVNVDLLVVRALDAEAVEFFLRTRRQKNTLTSKLWVCAYLLELQHAEMKSTASQLGKPWIRSPFTIIPMLGWFGVRSAFKWVKGAIYVYRTNLV